MGLLLWYVSADACAAAWLNVHGQLVRQHNLLLVQHSLGQWGWVPPICTQRSDCCYRFLARMCPKLGLNNQDNSRGNSLFSSWASRVLELSTTEMIYHVEPLSTIKILTMAIVLLCQACDSCHCAVRPCTNHVAKACPKAAKQGGKEALNPCLRHDQH